MAVSSIHPLFTLCALELNLTDLTAQATSRSTNAMLLLLLCILSMILDLPYKVSGPGPPTGLHCCMHGCRTGARDPSHRGCVTIKLIDDPRHFYLPAGE